MLPLRRSARIAALQAKRTRTPEEIQTALATWNHIHTRTILDIYHSIKIKLDCFENMIKESTVYQKQYLEKITSLRTYCYNYHIFALDTIDAMDELSDNIPCVTMMKQILNSLSSFVMSLEYDTDECYIMNNLVIPYCEQKIKLIKENM